MPLSYEDIEKGRRRNWDKLKDPEVRKEEERAEREAKAAQKKRAAADARQIARKRAAEQDKAQWEKTKREVKLILSVAFALVFTVVAVGWLIDFLQHEEHIDRVSELGAAVEGGTIHKDLSSPVDTYASWRSAWIRGEPADIYRTYTRERASYMRGNRSDQGYIRTLHQQIRAGHKMQIQSLAEQFSNPEIVVWPSARPDHGDLAVFKSQPVELRGERGTVSQWVLAIAWQDDAETWGVADVRQAENWDEKWDNMSKIPASRLRLPAADEDAQ